MIISSKGSSTSGNRGHAGLKIHISHKGGPGSGNWRHEGRPGKEGGSLPTGVTPTGAYATPKKPMASGALQSTGTTAITLPRVSIPVGQLPEHQKGDADGKMAYQEWYGNVATKPNLADALAMRRYFADRAMEAEGVLAQAGAEEREASRVKRAEEAANAPKYLTPAQKKAEEAAKKKAATAAAKTKKAAESAAAKKKRADEAAAKKAAAAAKKGATGAGKGEAGEAKATAKLAADRAKLEAQLKVAQAIGLGENSFTVFKKAVEAIKAGGTPPAASLDALVKQGLLTKVGDSITVPPAAVTLLSAILAKDAIRAKAALAKLGGTKEIGLVRVRKATRFIIGG